MSPKLACQVARNVACGLGLLHSKGIVHRDVKSSNVLIDLDSTEGPDGGPLVKLCDFDSAVPLSSSSAHTCYLAHRGVPPVDVCVGTPRWIAPEVLRAMYGRHSYGLVSFPMHSETHLLGVVMQSRLSGCTDINSQKISCNGEASAVRPQMNNID